MIIWNTDDVFLDDVNPFTGDPSSDIYVKGLDYKLACCRALCCRLKQSFVSPGGSCCAAVVAQNIKVEGKWKDLKKGVVYKML